MGARAASLVLLSDNFNANTPGTTDLNVDLARQTGVLAPLSYTMANGAGNYGHQLQNPNAIDQLLVADFPESTVSPNQNFNGPYAAGGLRISFDVDPNPAVYASGDQTLWGCINLGAAQADQLVNVNGGASHFGILFRQNGNIQAFDGSDGNVHRNLVLIAPIAPAPPFSRTAYNEPVSIYFGFDLLQEILAALKLHLLRASLFYIHRARQPERDLGKRIDVTGFTGLGERQCGGHDHRQEKE